LKVFLEEQHQYLHLCLYFF